MCDSPKLVGVVALYNPKETELLNIERYVDDLNTCFLMDDSEKTNFSIISEFLLRHPNVSYIYNNQNIGLCKSVNIGFRKACQEGADWILVMNPDGTFQNDAIQIYKLFIKEHDCKNIAIIAPKFNYDRHIRYSGKGYREIKYADMTGCIYNAKILEKLNYYDENTYFYGLDTEYNIRVRKAGYKIIECSEAVLNHCPAETRTLMILDKSIFRYGFDVPMRYYYQFRSCCFIYKKYGLKRSFYTILFHIYKLLKVILFFENKREYFKMIKLAIHDARIGYYGKYGEK